MIYFNNRNGSSGLTRRLTFPRLISATAIYGRWNSSLCRKGRWYITHKIFTCIGIPKHWRLSWFRYETFITFLIFRFSTRGERDTHNFYYADCSIWPDNALRTPSTKLDSFRFKSQVTVFFFFKIPKNLSPSLPCMTSFTSPLSFPIRCFYYNIIVTSSLREREHLHSMCAPH